MFQACVVEDNIRCENEILPDCSAYKTEVQHSFLKMKVDAHQQKREIFLHQRMEEIQQIAMKTRTAVSPRAVIVQSMKVCYKKHLNTIDWRECRLRRSDLLM